MDDSIVWLEEKRVERSKELKESAEQICITDKARDLLIKSTQTPKNVV